MEKSETQRVRINGLGLKTLQNSEKMMELVSDFPSFLGLDEGSLSASGLELDKAEAPRDRDPFSQQIKWRMDYYFSDAGEALDFAQKISSEFSDFEIQVLAVQNEDWNAEWRKNFQGVEVGEHWSICPPEFASDSMKKKIILNPGMGFGAGSHPTTYLMLEALGNRRPLHSKSVLDFGAGSGILGIAASLMGAQVWAVEVDPDALENARENAVHNRVTEKICFSQVLPAQKFDLILANILFDVLERFSCDLVERLNPGGEVWLSGFFEADAQALIEIYRRLNPRMRLVQIQSRESWCLVKLSLSTS